MQVEIVFPLDYLQGYEIGEKSDLLKKIQEWGDNNLENQKKWREVRGIIELERRRLLWHTKSISFDMDEITNPEDVMAMKLTWC